MIKNIVFDFGGVLVQYDFKAFFAKQLGSEEQAEWFMQHILNEESNNLIDKEDKPFGEYIADWKRQWPDYVNAIDALDKHYADIFTGEVPGITVLMEQLKAKGYRVLGLSNWSTKVFDVIRKFPKPFAQLEGSLISHEVHLLKPDVAIFNAFCQRFDVKPNECLFIDDKPENIAGAERAGLHGVVFTNTDQLREALKNEGIL